MDLLNVAHIIMLIFLVVTAVAAIRTKDLINSIIIFSAYSFTMAITYLILRAPDVAMTEAAVGGGVTSILFLSTMMKIKERREK